MVALELTRSELLWEQKKLEFLKHDAFSLRRRNTYTTPYDDGVKRIQKRIIELNKLISELEGQEHDRQSDQSDRQA